MHDNNNNEKHDLGQNRVHGGWKTYDCECVQLLIGCIFSTLLRVFLDLSGNMLKQAGEMYAYLNQTSDAQQTSTAKPKGKAVRLG